jgi:hypothetical protein
VAVRDKGNARCFFWQALHKTRERSYGIWLATVKSGGWDKLNTARIINSQVIG